MVPTGVYALAIPGELSGYADEEAFVRGFLVPLLRRMGFSIVADFHGKREFGKDLIIGEIDRFGHVVYYGVQAKYVPSISKSDAHGLIEDCSEAFAKDFEHPHTGSQQRTSRFYAVNGGSISDEARELFFASVSATHGDNARLLCGKDLLDLDRTVSVRSEAGRDALAGLLFEVSSNRNALAEIIPTLKEIAEGSAGHYPTARLRTVASSQALLRPSSLGSIDYEFVASVHDRAVGLNRSLDEVGVSPLHTVVSIKIPAMNALRFVGPLEKDHAALEALIKEELLALGPIAPL